MIDPFTRASPTYQLAMRHAFKSGPAYEGWKPKQGLLSRILEWMKGN